MNEHKIAVYVNGKLIGQYYDSGEKLLNLLREQRRIGRLSDQINFSYNPKLKSFYVNTDRGRVRRPYIIVKNGKSMLTDEIKDQLVKGEINFKYLLDNGIVEFLDAGEEENAYVALTEDEITEEHTHLDFDASTIYSVVTASLPYSNHNLSVRNTMACSQTKQALGMYVSNFNIRMDSRSHIMYYPQVPLVQTAAYDFLNLKKRPAGQNFVVAVATYYGYTMKDAIIINKKAIERGLARTVQFKTYKITELMYPGGQKDKFQIPLPTTSGYRGEESYKYLDEDGLISPEVPVSGGDVIVGNTSPPRFLEEISVFGVTEEKRRENSLSIKSGDKGIVDSVMVTNGIDGNRMVKVRVRDIKVPELGDKFSTRHGQKGVIGLIVPEEDMPFSENGIIPDLLINPHAIPSRMTVGHLIEMLGGKAGSVDASIKDGTAFTGDDFESFKKVLADHGFDEYGEEVFYDGLTGKKVKMKIFMGVIYYQRLHHLVSNKIHARSRGPVQLLTHQPTEGRAREGGLRFGEMERDCLVGYGASMLIKERLLDESDKATILVCNQCGSTAVHDYIRNRNYCPVCDSTDVSIVEVSYAFKLLLDEIKSIGIFPRLITSDKAE
ncbi:DNA-directed RNA polymerase subunit B [Candidatus Micrarchaeota archaeon]|nr:DNA-directed RNA polymerase subunit B [Candidatus Micrarchaeota archaeon]